MEYNGWDELLEDSPLIDWRFAPEGTIFYAEDYFRNKQGAWWDESTNMWRIGLQELGDLLRAKDYQSNPNILQYDNTLDDKWDNGNLGKDEDFVKVSDTSINTPIKSDGGSSSYYDIQLPDWLFDKIYERRYTENCYIKTEELIEVLGSDFDEGNILKCLVRINSLKKGKGKEGNDVTYDSNKIIYSAGRLKERDKR